MQKKHFPINNIIIDGIEYQANKKLIIYNNKKVKRGILAKDTRIGKTLYQGGKEVRFDNMNRLIKGSLVNELNVFGIHFEKQREIYYEFDDAYYNEWDFEIRGTFCNNDDIIDEKNNIIIRAGELKVAKHLFFTMSAKKVDNNLYYVKYTYYFNNIRKTLEFNQKVR